jgi:hypothetical protein
MKKAVAYNLINGHVPSFISDGGYYPNESEKLIGVTIDNPELPNDIVIFDTLQDLTLYLNSYKIIWQAPSDPTWVNYQPDTPLQAAEFIWQKLTS